MPTITAAPPLTFKQSIDSVLARRIAEAAHGHKGKPYWIVFSVSKEDHADGVRRHYVSKGWESEADADADAGKSQDRHRIGPFSTPPWATARNRTLVELLVTTQKNGQPEQPLPFVVDEHDSLFWTEAVVDKFVIPYYVGIHGPEYGVKIKETFNDPEVYALTHLPGSEYVGAVVPGEGVTPVLRVVPVIPG